MKIIFILFLLPLLISLTYNTDSCAAQAVVDTDGDFLFPGAKYFIVPRIASAGRVSGITMEFRVDGDNRCPLDVVVEPTPLSYGRPFSFTIAPRVGFVPISTVVNIESAGSAYCREFPTIWGVSDVTIPGGRRYITSGGARWSGFTIEEVKSDSTSQVTSYKFQYCSTGSGSDVSTCEDVGISGDTYGRRRLALGTKKPMLVSFKKATTESEGGAVESVDLTHDQLKMATDNQ